MKKYLCLLLCTCLLLPLLVGCQNHSEPTTTQPSGIQPSNTQTTADPWADYNMPTVDNEFFELLCDNCDATCYLLSSGQGHLTFQLVSSQDLQGKTVTITSNLGGTITWNPPSEDDGDPEALTTQAFLAYQGIDWATLEGENNALSSAIGQVSEAYEAARNLLPKLYSYRISLNLFWLGAEPGLDENGRLPDDDVIAALPPQTVETLTVTIGDQTKTYTLDNVLILGQHSTENTGPWGGITQKGSVIISDYPAHPSKDGTCEMKELRYEATDDVVLQNFTIPGAEILQCDVKIETEQGDKFNFRWDCNSAIEVDAGSEITLENIIMKDPKLANTLFANIWRNQILTYTNNGGGEYDGQEFNAVVPISIRMRVDPWDAYAWYVDGVDLLPYYIEYKNYEEE